MDRLGNPRSLADAINRALYMTPASDGVAHFHSFIKDYLSQKFQAAYGRAESDGEKDRLESLWLQITKAGESNE